MFNEAVGCSFKKKKTWCVVLHCINIQQLFLLCLAPFPMDRHRDYFQVEATKNKASKNLPVPDCLWTCIFIVLVLILTCEITGSQNGFFNCENLPTNYLKWLWSLNTLSNLYSSASRLLFLATVNTTNFWNYSYHLEWYLTVAIVFISLIANDIEQSLTGFCNFFWEVTDEEICPCLLDVCHSWFIVLWIF